MKKLYVTRKYVFAKSAQDAIRLERKQNVDDVWLDDDWKKNNENHTKEFGLKKN